MLKWCSNNEPMSIRIRIWSPRSGKNVCVYIVIHVNFHLFFLKFKILTLKVYEVNNLYCEVTKLYLSILNSVEPKYCRFITPEPPYSTISDISTHLFNQERPHWLNFLRRGAVSSVVSGFCFGQRFAESWHPNVVGLYLQEFCTDSFFHWVDGV